MLFNTISLKFYEWEHIVASVLKCSVFTYALKLCVSYIAYIFYALCTAEQEQLIIELLRMQRLS